MEDLKVNEIGVCEHCEINHGEYIVNPLIYSTTLNEVYEFICDDCYQELYIKS